MSQIFQGDALQVLPTFPEGCVDVVVTSPRYNFGKNYPGVSDKTSMDTYFEEMHRLARNLYRVIKPEGALFLNVGTRSTNPIHDILVAQEFMKAGWIMQERFVWQKATDDAGHFTPITSDTYVNNLWESIFLFTKDGKVTLDRLTIGVPFKDETNTKRWKHGKSVRCRGDVWFIPYETITNRARDRKGHEATFPRELVIRCLRLVEHGRKGLKVLDPCCGTGTVPIIAVEQGHHGVGIDLSTEMAQEASAALAEAKPACEETPA